MKKRIISLCMVVCLLAVAIVGGTMAYFTDTDSAKNTMQMGNIEIEQTEWQRNPEGGFSPFTQNKLLMPGVYSDDNGKADTKVTFNDKNSLYIADGTAWCDFWSEDGGESNAVDKIVTVQNTGKHDVYYRTLIAIEDPDGEFGGSWNPASKDKVLVFNFNSNNRFKWTYVGDITVGGVTYNLHEALYTEVLIPGEMSRPSLLQVMFSRETTQESVEAYGDELDILCLTQAVQKDGFKQVGENAAQDALDTAFGDVTVKLAEGWFAEVK